MMHDTRTKSADIFWAVEMRALIYADFVVDLACWTLHILVPQNLEPGIPDKFILYGLTHILEGTDLIRLSPDESRNRLLVDCARTHGPLQPYKVYRLECLQKGIIST